MPIEPTTKMAIAFFDGQNLFRAAKEAFGYTYPNYDPIALANQICTDKKWQLKQTRFYTGVPDKTDSARWNHFWTAKLGALGHRGAVVYSRPLRYRNKTIKLAGGVEVTTLVGEEKGIDVRIALDVIRLAHRSEFDVALIFSQDQDLSEVADEIRVISKEQTRWIKVASAFPDSPTCRNRRGINGTDWVHINRATYDAHIDPKDYRPKP